MAIEELGMNILTYGFNTDQHCNGYVRVTIVDGEIWIRIYDDAKQFNLREYLKKDENLSAVILDKILSKLDYQHNAGVNTLVLKV